MALSPWLGSIWLESRTAAALLAGIRPDKIIMRPTKNLSPGWHEAFLSTPKGREFDAWWHHIKEAIASDELPAHRSVLPSQKRKHEEWLAMDIYGWPWEMSLNNDLMAWLKKPDIHAWLLKKRIADEDILEEIRTYPREDAGDEADDTRDELTRAYEAMGLMAETIAQLQGPLYQWGGRPNCAQIAKAMEEHAGSMAGMRADKLQRLVSKALNVWEDRRR